MRFMPVFALNRSPSDRVVLCPSKAANSRLARSRAAGVVGMPQLYSKNRIMPHFACRGSVGAEEDLDDLRNHSVIVVVRNPPLASFLALRSRSRRRGG